MAKLLVIAALAVLVWWMVTGRWPWQPKLTRRQRQIERARRLLQVPARAGRADIQAAHRRLMATAHPDRGGTAVMATRANEARDILLAALPADPIAVPPKENP
ncbi:molecular chaperone DnaJ [Croceibacterium sp. TMG7-5b_MA50]|uniref:molecular chaperone DnaJ n=1 Tax=Croceibacterium sp. TMG7-5b_MA50 TaxID=3121290 RepID=UPI003221E0DB